ncbi:SNF2-related protein [Frigoribacterium sp. CG_9.8]|uniref:SNF2-related protein n=1 Tax=Frigoribacterium sp. CG_9.8 TaxID=2787733 RepID=UPI0018CBF029|nr:SNF2-related protein [Frigoribacterium sp. CG_9.8]MBG6106607.1 superfamily II DNA or RNA helicase [Frigoribacterium sp. CG_9.8]
MKLTPRPDQEEKIQRVLREPTQGALIADDMGKGKTLMGAEILTRSDWNRVLITGVRDTSKQWAATIDGQSDGRVKLRVMNSLVGGEKNWAAFMEGEPGVYFAGIQWLTSRDWEVIQTLDHNGNTKPVLDKKTGLPTGKVESQSVHKELFRRRLNTKKRHIDAVIFDEVHKMQNRHSQAARSITSIKSDWRIGMSGTFMGNNFQGAWKVTRWIWPDLIDNSFVRWRHVWCSLEYPTGPGGDPIRDRFGAPTEKVVGEKDEGAYVAQLPCYIRDEPDPVPLPRIVKVKLTPQQSAQYLSMEDKSMAWVPSSKLMGREPLLADLTITQRQRLRTMTLGEVRLDEDDRVTFDIDTPSAKLNSLKFIIDNIWQNMPVLIGCYSVDFVDVATARLQRAGYGAVAWHGGIPPKKREDIKQRFIARDPTARYLVCTIPSIGTGTDGLQFACSKLVWLEESESQIDNEQFVKRSFRDGMTTDFGEFEHVKIVAEGTIDEGIIMRHDAASQSMRNSLRAA